MLEKRNLSSRQDLPLYDIVTVGSEAGTTGHLTEEYIFENIHENNQENDGNEGENSPEMQPVCYHECKDDLDILIFF